MHSTVLMLSMATMAAAHGVVTNVFINGADQSSQICEPFNTGSNPDPSQCVNVRVDDNGPVDGDYNKNQMRCGNGKGKGETTPVGAYVAAAAGDSVGFKWSSLACVDGHHGPMDTYMSRCPNDDCSTYNGDGDWFKIDQLTSKNGLWGNEYACTTQDTVTMKIPPVPEGRYIIRHQWLALHSADILNKAQFYPQCINFDIKGGAVGDDAGLTPTGKIPGMFQAEDPGVHFNLYDFGDIDARSLVYPDPGVALCASCGGAPSSANPAPASSATTAASVADEAEKQSTIVENKEVASQESTEPSASPSNTANNSRGSWGVENDTESDAWMPASSASSEAPSSVSPAKPAASTKKPCDGKRKYKRRQLRY